MIQGKIRFLLASAVLMILLGREGNAQPQKVDQLYPLWTGGEIPTSNAVPVLKHVKFIEIKKYEPQVDQYRFLHGMAIARFQHQWVVSFGHNKGAENTGSEEAQSMISKTGRRWGDLHTIDNPAGDIAVSHGVLLNFQDTLFSFNASFEGIMQHMHTNAYYWDRDKSNWVLKGVNVAEGFWPLQEPQRMRNGSWIMAGAYFGKKATIPAVAICKANDFRHWQVNKVPVFVDVWGECGVIINGPNVLLISRSSMNTPKFEGHSHPLAWVSLSKDYGQTWSALKPSNLPMAASKPYAGTLSNGQHYLIGTTTADAKNNRRPLTIAVSKPEENSFSKIYTIRGALHKGHKVESNAAASLAYPYAVEYEGALYVVYSNSGGRGGAKRDSWNNNSAELAIIPIKELSAN